MVDRLSRIDVPVSLNSHADSGILTTPSNNVNSATGQQPRQNRTVVVRFSYTAQQDDELDLKEGEKLEILEDVEDGWARGQVLDTNGVAIGKSGMFPTNFVDSLSPVAEARSRTQIDPIGWKQASQQGSNGVHDQKPEAAGVLPPPIKNNQPQFQRNAKSTVISGSDASSPFFPTTGGANRAIPVKETARVMYKYEAANSDELSLPEGAIVTILNKNCEDDGWYEGEYQGARGLFPENFVKLVESVPQATTPTTPNPPQLPAKPSKAGIRAHQRTISDGPTVHNPHSGEVKPLFGGQPTPIIPINPSVETQMAPPRAMAMENDRKSMVANLQSILFRDGKLPQKKPVHQQHHPNASETVPTPNSANSTAADNSPHEEPSISDEADKLTSLTKARPKQANKRPPSMNFRVSVPPQKFNEQVDSVEAHPVPTGLQTIPQRATILPLIQSERAADVDTHIVVTHSQVPPARPSPPHGIPLTPSIKVHQGSSTPANTIPVSTAVDPHPKRTASEWVSMEEFDKYKEETSRKLEELRQMIAKLAEPRGK